MLSLPSGEFDLTPSDQIVVRSTYENYAARIMLLAVNLAATLALIQLRQFNFILRKFSAIIFLSSAIPINRPIDPL